MKETEHPAGTEGEIQELPGLLREEQYQQMMEEVAEASRWMAQQFSPRGHVGKDDS